MNTANLSGSGTLLDATNYATPANFANSGSVGLASDTSLPSTPTLVQELTQDETTWANAVTGIQSQIKALQASIPFAQTGFVSFGGSSTWASNSAGLPEAFVTVDFAKPFNTIPSAIASIEHFDLGTASRLEVGVSRP